MADEKIKRSLIAQRRCFDKSIEILEQKLTDYIGNRSSFNLKEVQSQLEFVRKQFEKVYEKGSALAESADDEISKYGDKELEDVSEKFKKIQERGRGKL